MNENVKPIRPHTVIEAKAENSKIATGLRELADLIEKGEEGDLEFVAVVTCNYAGYVHNYGYGENMRVDRVLGTLHVAMHKITIDD